MAKILSIEVGYSLTRICEMDYRVKIPKIYKYVCIPTPQGVVEDGFLAENAEFIDLVKKTLAENKMKTKQAVFSVSSSKIATREILLPAVKTSQIDTLIKSNASDYFPIDLADYELAHLILGVIKGEDGKADKYKVMVMAASKNLVSGYERFASRCGLRLQSLDYTGNSIYQIMKNECKEDTEMVIKVEEKSAIAIVISNQILMLQRTIVYGVDDAIQTLMHSPAFEEKSYRDALEIMKRKTCIKVVLNDNTRVIEEDDVSDENERMSSARREVADSLTPLVMNVAKVVDLYNSKNPDSPIKKVALVGLGSDISGLSKLFTNELGIRTIVMNDLKSINWNRSAGEGNPGKYIANIGSTFAPVGFINEEKKKSNNQSVNYRIATVCSALFFLTACVIVSAIALKRYRDALENQMRLQRLETEYAPGEEIYNTYHNVSAFYKEMEIGYKLTEHPNDNLVPFLLELEQKLPADAQLVEFTSDSKEATLKIKTINKEEAAKIIQTLRDFDSVIDVKIGALDKEDMDSVEKNAQEGDPRVIFSVVCSYETYTVEETTAAPVTEDVTVQE